MGSNKCGHYHKSVGLKEHVKLLARHLKNATEVSRVMMFRERTRV